MLKFISGLLIGLFVGTTVCAVVFVEADQKDVNDLKRIVDNA